MNASLLPVKKLREAIVAWLDKYEGDDNKKLLKLVTEIKDAVKADKLLFSDDYVLAAALLEVSEHGLSGIQAPSQKSEDKKS